MPLTGGTPRAFLGRGNPRRRGLQTTPASSTWLHDDPGDPLSLADRTGADAAQIVVAAKARRRSSEKACTHTIPCGHQTASGFTSSADRIRRARWTCGACDPRANRRSNSPIERAGEFSGAARFANAALCGARGGLVGTVALGARRRKQGHATRDRGPRAIHVGVRQPRRPARRRHRRKPHRQPVARATARSAGRRSRCAALPGANRTSPGATLRRNITVLSLALGAGTGDGLWQVQNGQAFEVRKGADGVLSEPPAVSPDGSRVVVVVRQEGKRRLAIMSADGTNSRTLAPSIEIKGAVGQGTADWSPDGAWIVTGGRDARGRFVQDPSRRRRARAARRG